MISDFINETWPLSWHFTSKASWCRLPYTYINIYIYRRIYIFAFHLRGSPADNRWRFRAFNRPSKAWRHKLSFAFPFPLLQVRFYNRPDGQVQVPQAAPPLWSSTPQPSFSSSSPLDLPPAFQHARNQAANQQFSIAKQATVVAVVASLFSSVFVVVSVDFYIQFCAGDWRLLHATVATEAVAATAGLQPVDI